MKEGVVDLVHEEEQPFLKSKTGQFSDTDISRVLSEMFEHNTKEITDKLVAVTKKYTDLLNLLVPEKELKDEQETLAVKRAKAVDENMDSLKRKYKELVDSLADKEVGDDEKESTALKRAKIVKNLFASE